MSGDQSFEENVVGPLTEAKEQSKLKFMKKKTLLERLKESIERLEERLSNLIRPQPQPIPVPVEKPRRHR
jgi:hypothetical protein